MRLRRLFILSFAAVAMLTVSAKTSNVLDLKHSITDNNIVFPEAYEQDTQKLLEGWYMKNYTATDTKYKTASDPSTSDEVIMERLASLPTAIDLPFNQIVRQYIDRYTKKGRSGVAAMLGLSHYYMPIFEQALEEAGLPLELKYLPVIESGLNPNAVSRMGATGLWQFMISAAKGYNLEVNSLVDERRDPYQSSRAAAAFLKDLYSTYGDWSLVIAAYNCGPGNVNKALRRAGGDASNKDFWAIYPYLPAETRGYVPMFIAATYVMNYYPEHNISPVLATKPLVTDTVAVNSRVHFNQIAKVLNLPIDEIRILNPQFRNDLIPGTAKKPYMLILPSQQVHAYLMSEADIKNYDADKYARRVVAEPGVGATSLATDDTADNAIADPDDDLAEEIVPTEADEALAEDIAEIKQTAVTKKSASKHTYTHKVQEGESLADIANTYGVTKSEIKVQNNLRREAVRVGQELRITTTQEVAQQQTSKKKSTADTSDTQASRTSSRTSSRSNSTATTSNNTASNSVGTTKAKARDKNTNKQQETASTSKSKKSSSTKQQETASTSKSKKSSSTKQQETASNSKSKKSSKKDSNASSSKQSKNEHSIKEGESLSSISKKYGVSVDELKKANNMKNDNIRAGKTLNIPKKKKETAKSSSSKKDSSTKKSDSSSSKKSGSSSSSKKKKK